MSQDETEVKRRFTSRSGTSDVLKDRDLKGLTIAITGTTNGIGVETARSLAIAGAHVVMLCRNVVAAEDVKQSILAEKANCEVDIIKCDLGSLHSTKTAADTFLEKGWSLHILILNAGMVEATQPAQTDGLNTLVATNHLAGYYLTSLLINRMLETKSTSPTPCRVVFVSSEGHRLTSLPSDVTADNLTKEMLFHPQSAVGVIPNFKYYGTSKLCTNWSAAYLQRKYGSQGINFYSVHPGVIHTHLGTSRLFKTFMWIARPFLKSISQGAATTVFCATASELDANFGAGKYFSDSWIANESAMAKDASLQDKMASLSDEQIAETINAKS